MHHCVNSKEDSKFVMSAFHGPYFSWKENIYIIIYNCDLATLHCSVSELLVLLLPLRGACCKMIGSRQNSGQNSSTYLSIYLYSNTKLQSAEHYKNLFA